MTRNLSLIIDREPKLKLGIREDDPVIQGVRARCLIDIE